MQKAALARGTQFAGYLSTDCHLSPRATAEETNMPAVFELKSNDDGRYFFHCS
jgi:hypothetical protein